MKAVQVGILVALVVCAGLLFMVYRGQRSAPAPPAPVAASAPAPEPVPVAEAQPAPPPEPEKPAPAAPKPSPTRKAKKKESKPLEAVAPAPAPEPVPRTEPVEEEPPAPEPPQRAALNPPSGTETAPPAPPAPQTVTIPAGTLITVRLQEALSSDKNAPGDAFAATLDQPLIIDGFAIAERGARVQGKVLEAVKAGRVRGVAALALHLTRLHTTDGQEIAIETESVDKTGPTSKGEDAKKVGVAAAIGAAIGAIAGGGKGAAIGAGVGGAAGAGTVAATRGKPAELPVETRLTFHIQQPVTITERIP